MIQTMIYNCLKCDDCGAYYTYGGCDEQALLNSARQDGWCKIGFKDYCPKCKTKYNMK